MFKDNQEFIDALEKAKTGQDFRDALMLLPDNNFRELLPTLEFTNLDIAKEKIKGDAILNQDLCLSELCQMHVELLEKAIGVPLQTFLSNPARLHIALTKATPLDINTPDLIDGGSYNWGDLYCSDIGIGSEIWPATKFELEVREYLRKLAHEWLEFGCWCLPDDHLIKLECLNYYAELVRAAKHKSRDSSYFH